MDSITRSNSFLSTPLPSARKTVKTQRQISGEGAIKTPQPLSRGHLPVQAVGKSHLVQLDNDSLFSSKNEELTNPGDALVIDTSTSIVSRRGPNQEVFDQIDGRQPPKYGWYPVVSRNGWPLEGEQWYIREDAFITDQQACIEPESLTKDKSLTQESSAQEGSPTREEGKRGRFQDTPSFDFPVSSVPMSDQLQAVEELERFIDSVKSGSDKIDVKAVIVEFTDQLSKNYGGSWMSILYGSYASGSQRAESDIDVMFCCDNQSYLTHKPQALPQITHFLAILHERVGANVDDEVPPESKHIISAMEMMEAASCRVFYPANTDGVSDTADVRPLSFFLDKVVTLEGGNKSESQRFSTDFLKSKYLRLRLLFNILTTPNVIHANDPQAANTLEDKVKHALSTLSKDLQGELDRSPGENTHQQISHLLGKGEDRGEYWLGYKENREGVVDKLVALLVKSDGEAPMSTGENRHFVYP